LEIEIDVDLGEKMNKIETKTGDIEIPGCVRRISNSERLFLWSVSSNIAVAARIIGDVDKTALSCALDTVRYRMHPLLGAKVIFDSHNDAWYSIDNVPETLLRVVPRISEAQWFDEIKYERLVPFQPEKGPLIRFVLVYSPQVSELIVFSNHCICDGVALANLIRDILLVYANPTSEVQILHPPVIPDYVGKDENHSNTGTAKTVYANGLNNQWRNKPHYFTQADFNVLHSVFWKRVNYGMVLIQLDQKETSDLTTRCREKGITITSALTTAFLAAHQDVIGQFPEDRSVLSIPFDLRRRLKENIGDVFCCLAGAFAFPFAYNLEKSFWKNAEDYHKAIQNRVETLDISDFDVEPFDPMLINAAMNFAPYVEHIPEVSDLTENLSAFAHDTENIAFKMSQVILSKLPSMIVTNLGRMCYPESYGDLKLDRMFFLPAAPGSVPNTHQMILGSVSISGKLTLSLNYIENTKEDVPSITRVMISMRNRALEYLGFPEKANDRAI